MFFKKKENAEEEKSEEKTSEVEEEKQGKKFSFKLILIYGLLLAAGLFLGIVFAYALRL